MDELATPFSPVHPGELIKDELECRQLSQKLVAERLGLPYTAFNEVLNGKRPVTTDLALVLEAALGIPAYILVGMQSDYNLQVGRVEYLAESLGYVLNMPEEWMFKTLLDGQMEDYYAENGLETQSWTGQSGYPGLLYDWVLEQEASGCDRYLLSVDQLLYGGLVASRLAEKGVRHVRIFDVSHTDVSEQVSAAFQCSHLVFASATYNGGIYTPMETLLLELKAHALQNRSVALIENGSWGPAAARLMAKHLEEMKGMEQIAPPITIRSAVKEEQYRKLEDLADLIAADIAAEE